MILLADADPDSRAIYGAALESRGYRVRTAESSAAALHLLEHAAFDVVLVDFWSATADGRQIVEAAHATDAHQTVVIALTVRALKDELAAVTGAGCDEVLVKPISPVSVVEVVDRALHSMTAAIQHSNHASTLEAKHA